MRIRIIFELKNKGAVLPFHHQKQIRALFRQVVGEDYLTENQNFNFSGLKGQTKVGREGLHYFSKFVTLVCSSIDKEFINYFINKLFDYDNILLGDLLLEPINVEKEVNDKPFNESMRFLCLSPLVVLDTGSNDKNKEFIHPTLDRFSDYLYESTMMRMERSKLYSSSEIESFYKFQLIPDKVYLDKIHKREKKFARIYTTIKQGKILEIRGYTFPFALYAHPKVQEFVYNCGFGELTANGFGMLDFVDIRHITKEIIFEKQLGEVDKEKLKL